MKFKEAYNKLKRILINYEPPDELKRSVSEKTLRTLAEKRVKQGVSHELKENLIVTCSPDGVYECNVLITTLKDLGDLLEAFHCAHSCDQAEIINQIKQHWK